MPYIIILQVRKFHQPTANGFRTARQKPEGEGGSLNRVKITLRRKHLPKSKYRILLFGHPVKNSLDLNSLSLFADHMILLLVIQEGNLNIDLTFNFSVHNG